MNRRYRAQLDNRSSAGFTLVELVLALTVLAVAVAGSARLVSNAYQHLAITEQYQRAYYLADSHLQSLSTQNIQPGSTQGIYTGIAQPDLPWVLNLVQLLDGDMPEANDQISEQVIALRATLTVSLPDQARRVQLNTLILRAPHRVGSAVEPSVDISAERQRR